MNATQNRIIIHGVDSLSRFLSFACEVTDPVPTGDPGFLTFWDPGWNILRLREAVANKGTIFNPQIWYANEPFVRLEEQPRYRQLCMTAVPNSFDKTFEDQQALLPPDEEVPSARVVIMGMVIHFLATGERILPDCLVQCITEDSVGRRVNVGYFGSDGFSLSYYWDGYRNGDLGLASSRKF